MRRLRLTFLLLVLPAAAGAEEKAVLVLNTGGHTNHVRAVFFTPDGSEVVSVGEDRTVRVWGAGDGAPRRVLRLPLGAGDRGVDLGLAAALSPDGKTVAVGAEAPGTGRHQVYLVSLAGERVERVLAAGKGALWAVAFSPDGKRLATGGDRRSVLVWDLETGKVRHELTGHTGGLRCLAFSPDSTLLASGGTDKTVRLWSVDAGKAEGTPLEGHAGRVVSLAWAPDGKTLASAGPGEVRLWDPAAGTQRQALKGQFNGHGLAYSGDSSLLLVGPTLFDAVRGTVQARLREEAARAGALSRDGKRAAWSGDDRVLLWTPEGRGRATRELFRLEGGGRVIHNVAWGLDGKSLAWERDAEGKGPTFHLAELAFGAPADRSFVAARDRAGPVSLEHASGHLDMLVRREGRPPVTLASGEPPGAWTLLGEGQAVVGGATALKRYDTTTGKLLHRAPVGILAVAPSPDGELFVTGGADQTLRVWSRKHERPLLLLFVSGGEWIAWTPQGYYAASPGGERLMGWQADDGPDRLAVFHPAARFRQSLYRPDVIARVVAERDVTRAVVKANKEAKRDEPALDVEQVLPPRVTITSPEKGVLTVDRERLDVRAVAESVGAHPVLSMQLLLDGRPYGGEEGLRTFRPEKPGTGDAAWTVTLTPGRHTLAVLAKTGPSNGMSPPVEVTFAAPAPAAAPDLYVLAVGINEYRTPELRLTIAVNDAEELAETFRRKGKGVFNDVKVRVLTDGKATRAGIRTGLEWLRQNKKPRDLAVIFFSAHGCVGDDRKLYLLAHDSDEEKPEATGFGGAELKRRVSGLPGRVLVLLSDCHAGATPGTARPSRGELARDLADDDCGALVICAALGSEKSLGSREKKHSYFTLALIEALCGGSEDSPGEADYNKDGFISSTELFLYTQLRVNKLTFGRQTPTMTSPPLAPFVVSRP